MHVNVWWLTTKPAIYATYYLPHIASSLHFVEACERLTAESQINTFLEVSFHRRALQSLYCIVLGLTTVMHETFDLQVKIMILRKRRLDLNIHTVFLQKSTVDV